MSLFHITSISSTQFQVVRKDDLTNTIVEETKVFDKDKALFNVDTNNEVSITDSTDMQGFKFQTTDVSVPTFTSVSDLYLKLKAICTT